MARPQEAGREAQEAADHPPIPLVLFLLLPPADCLGIDAKFRTTPWWPATIRPDGAVARMNLRALAAADPDTPQRQRNCGVVPVGSQVEIRIKDGSAYYCGLEICGNVWLCPVCSAKIHRRRADELREALTAWDADGHATSLVTITVPHDLDDPLSKLVDAERAAWKRVAAGAAWLRLKRRLGIVRHIIALEFTWGDENGWHPHYHVLLVHDQDLGAAAIAALHGHIHSRLATRPLFAPPKTVAGRRVVIIPAPVLPVIEDHLATHALPGPDGLLFTSPEGRLLRHSAFRNRVWIPAVTATGLTGVHFHDLRHASNNLVAEAGASLRELMDRMGHASSRAALIYLHTSLDAPLPTPSLREP